jgi:hypothetical protein
MTIHCIRSSNILVPLKIYVRPAQVLTGYGCTRAELPDWDGHVIGRYAETMFLKKYSLGGLFMDPKPLDSDSNN